MACYSAPVGVQGIAISLSVCLSVCLSVSISLGLLDWSSQIIMQICSGHVSVLLWQRCNTLRTSGFMDDVTFGRSGPYSDAWLAALWYRGESDVYECLVLCWGIGPFDISCCLYGISQQPAVSTIHHDHFSRLSVAQSLKRPQTASHLSHTADETHSDWLLAPVCVYCAAVSQRGEDTQAIRLP